MTPPRRSRGNRKRTDSILMVWFTERVQFDADAVAEFVRQESGRELHRAIRPAPVYSDSEEADDLAREAAEVRSCFSDHSGRKDEPSADDLALLLSKPACALYGWVNLPAVGVRYGALVAINGPFGIFATARDGEIFLRTISRAEIGDAVVDDFRGVIWKSVNRPLRTTSGELDFTGQIRIAEDARRVDELLAMDTYLTCEFHMEGVPGGVGPLRFYGLGTVEDDRGCWSVETDGDLIEMAPAGPDDFSRLIGRLVSGGGAG